MIMLKQTFPQKANVAENAAVDIEWSRKRWMKKAPKEIDEDQYSGIGDNSSRMTTTTDRAYCLKQ